MYFGIYFPIILWEVMCVSGTQKCSCFKGFFTVSKNILTAINNYVSLDVTQMLTGVIIAMFRGKIGVGKEWLS